MPRSATRLRTTSGLITRRISPRDSAYAWLLPRANSSLRPFATRRRRGSTSNSRRTMSALPSTEALSTTMTSARIPSTAERTERRQSRSKSLVFHETTRTDSVISLTGRFLPGPSH